MYLENVGIRSIERIEKISSTLIINWIRKYSKIIQDSINSFEVPQGKEGIEILEVDELCTFIKKPKNGGRNVFIWVAVDRRTQKICVELLRRLVYWNSFVYFNRLIFMIPRRFEKVLFLLMLSCLMSFIISGISIFRSIGFTDDFFTTWINGWLVSWLVSFPTASIVSPIAKGIVNKIVSDE